MKTESKDNCLKVAKLLEKVDKTFLDEKGKRFIRKVMLGYISERLTKQK